MKKMNKKGFTIVELVIVIAVIAILAAVLIPTFSGVVAKANESAAKQLAMSGVKSSLLMVNTATLPENTLILINSSKKADADPDYCYKYTGNALGDNPEKLKVNNAFNTSLFEDTTTFFVNREAIVDSDGNLSTTNADLVLSMINKAKSKSYTKSNFYQDNKGNITLGTPVDAVYYADKDEYNTAKGTSLTDVQFAALDAAEKIKTPATVVVDFAIYTSPDIPSNVVVCLPLQ